MLKVSTLFHYLIQHPHYISSFLKDICMTWWWQLIRQPIVVLTTESGGLGDYLWFRSYYSTIRKHYAPKTCRIIVIGMCQWKPLVLKIDDPSQPNHFDIYRPFESPDNPLKIESLFFKLFKADVYVNFRAKHLKKIVLANQYFFGRGFRESKQYYENVNNNVIEQWFPLPSDFMHKPPLSPITNTIRKYALDKPYIVVVEGGNTQGKLSEQQILTIIENIISFGYNIFFNGDYKKLFSTINHQGSSINCKIIDGYTYPLHEYPSIVAKSHYVVTVNSFIYHLAIQFKKPCVVISANEYESIKLDAPNQIILFNEELQQAYENQTLISYNPSPEVSLQDISCKRIETAILEINDSLCHSRHI